MSKQKHQPYLHACNAHLHIIDPVFSNDGKAATQIGTIETYMQLAQELIDKNK